MSLSQERVKYLGRYGICSLDGMVLNEPLEFGEDTSVGNAEVVVE